METWIYSGESASEGTSEGSDENSQNVSSVPFFGMLCMVNFFIQISSDKNLISLFALYMLINE